MIRFVCDCCGTFFDVPLLRSFRESLGDFHRDYTEALCPICCCDSFSSANSCPTCSSPKRTSDTLCNTCRAGLKQRFLAFADDLTPAESAQLDDWLDGDTIENRRNWI